MALEELYGKLQLLNLKDAVNSKLGVDIPEHSFVDDIGFKRIVLMWEIIKPEYIINLAYESYNGVLTFKVQLKVMNTQYVVSKNFSFLAKEMQNINSVVRFSAATVESCINQVVSDFKKVIKELNKAQKRIKKNG